MREAEQNLFRALQPDSKNMRTGALTGIMIRRENDQPRWVARVTRINQVDTPLRKFYKKRYKKTVLYTEFLTLTEQKLNSSRSELIDNSIKVIPACT